MQTRGNVRQGFGGNYKRNSDPPKPPSPQTQPAFSGNSHLQQHATNPPPTETVVKVSSVMTVTKSLPAAEHTVQIEQGPARVRSPTSDLHSNMSSSPDTNRSSHSEHPRPTDPEEQTQSPSVRAMLSNFQNRSNNKSQPWSSSSRRQLEPACNYQPVPRTKVKELKESLMRLSNENLSNIDDDNVSPSHSTENLSNKRTYSQPVVPPMYVSSGSGHVTSDRTDISEVSPAEKSRRSSNSGNTGVLRHNGDTQSHSFRLQDNHQTQSHLPMKSDYLTNGASSCALHDSEGSSSSSLSLPQDQDEVIPKQRAPERLHKRQKSQEEIDYEKQAALVAQRLKDEDRHLSEVIQPPPDHKTTTDFMVGIFDTKVDLKRKPSLLRKSMSASTVRHRSHSNPSPERRLNSSLPNSSPNWSPLGTETVYIQGASMTIDKQKEELQCKLQRKLEILRDEKELLDGEIEQNKELGKELTIVVEKKCQNRAEYDKYKLYVDELDKVMILLLKLSSRLARAENAVLSLPEDASDKQRSMLTTTRDQIKEKHEDAKTLKEGIDRRSKLVAGYLKKYLTEEEFGDYEFFVKMKSKLTMESQEIDDQIKLGEEQLKELRKSLTSSQS